MPSAANGFLQGKEEKDNTRLELWSSEAARERVTPGWSRSTWARTLFLLYLPLQHRIRNTKPIQIKQFAHSAAFFSWAASSLQAAPLHPPAFLVASWKLQKEKKRRKELFGQRPDSLQEKDTPPRKHGHGGLGMVLASYSARSWRTVPPQAALWVSGLRNNEKAGSWSSCTFSAGLLDVFLANAASWVFVISTHSPSSSREQVPHKAFPACCQWKF